MEEETKTDYNIEYAHIYANEQFGPEHKKSIGLLKKVIYRLKKTKKNYVLTILVDEYNPQEHELNIEEFLKKIAKIGPQPDFVGFESYLVPYKDLIIQEMKGKIKKGYENYIKKNKKVPCSLLIAIWNLKRLGLIKIKKEELKYLGENNKTFVAKKIITILPKKYQTVEKKAQKIIKSTRFKNCLKDISNIFFN